MKLKSILENIIAEWHPEHGFAQLIPYLEDKLNIKVGSPIHSGTMSDVFDLGDKVLKITSTDYDAAGLYIGVKNPTYPIPKVYSLYKIDQSEISKHNYSITSPLSGKDLWVAIVEKVKPIKATIKQRTYIQNWFEENTRYVPGDVTSENVGINSKGELVYLDPAFYSTRSLANNIPVLR